MSVLQTIGSTGSIKQSVTKQWTYPSGEVSSTVYKGVYDAISNLYTQYKTVAAYQPDYDRISFVYQRGTGTLTVDVVEDGEKMYELIPNELSNPIWSHPYFITEATALTADEIRDVRRKFEVNSSSVCPFTDKQQELWDLMAKGTTEYIVSSYVLRETQIVSKRSTVTASFDNVNEVIDPPSTSEVNALIGELPDGEWLKKAPSVRLIGARRWQIETEWWWAEKWSELLYGGTGEP